MSGKFITLEGGEGVGKSTQLTALAAALTAHGLSVVTTREPGGSPGAEAIRHLLMSGSGDRWSARAEALLFAAARADHIERIIRPALERGEWVICDRFIDSTRAYQGGAGGLPDAEIMTLHKIGSGGLMPDRTLLLTLSADDAAARTLLRDGDHPDRFGEKNRQYHQSVTETFERLAASEPMRIRIVSAAGMADEVTERLLAHTSDLL